ncbi:MAG: hypothetical protein GXX96_39130 [Planctomycetaceae bacterium]|nr:hypothetical protein [Planctomycetaceae bacterium]
MRRMLALVLAVCSIGGPALVGCGPELTEEDLGEVQTEASQLPAAGEPYDMPEGQFPADSESDADHP